MNGNVVTLLKSQNKYRMTIYKIPSGLKSLLVRLPFLAVRGRRQALPKAKEHCHHIPNQRTLPPYSQPENTATIFPMHQERN
ncbi:hypothetical protein E2C01_102767 [Portunus trituberculatus]|uniref:Uncharacterized protein n=1 Tax=Portunus trituberculatus TaxID=210409 RepID=A0A5B7KI44_PORTR|nr:hypothetical protein [Portunus trituberculatus]